jgi:hypothetical protein
MGEACARAEKIRNTYNFSILKPQDKIKPGRSKRQVHNIILYVVARMVEMRTTQVYKFRRKYLKGSSSHWGDLAVSGRIHYFRFNKS